MSEKEGFVPEEARVKGPETEQHAEIKIGHERIEGDIWRPGIMDQYSADVAVAASTKGLRRTEDVALRLLGDQKRFDKPMKDRIRAGRILAELRDEVDPKVDLHKIVKSQLAHSGEVKKVDPEFVADLVKGNLPNKQILKTDGLITDLKGYPLYISAADCYPVGVYDPDHKAIGAFHNGFYGLLNRISENGVAAMAKEYGSDPSKLKVTIGPGISAKTYTITQELMENAREKFGPQVDEWITSADEPGLYHLDLKAAIIQRLTDLGIRPENIESSQYSTDQNNDLFPSERVEGGANRDSFGFMMVLK